MTKCYVCQKEIPDGDCRFITWSVDQYIPRHTSCSDKEEAKIYGIDPAAKGQDVTVATCLDCGYVDILENFHKRDHGGWDCPKCYGEIK